MLKKILTLILVLSLLITNNIYAGYKEDEEKEEIVKLNGTGDSLVFHVGGTAAQGGIRFVTVGYQFKLIINGVEYSGEMTFSDNGATGETIEYILPFTQSSQSIIEILKSKYVDDVAIIENYLASGGVVILDAIMQISYNGVKASTKYYAEEDILTAISWTSVTQSDIVSYFDIIYEFPPQEVIAEAPDIIPVVLGNEAAILQASPRGNEPFDVVQGIPTGEELYIQVTTPEYIVELETNHHTGIYVHSYEIPTGGYGPNGEVLTILQHDYYDYSYYTISRLEVFGIDRVKVMNYALPNGVEIIEPNRNYYVAPVVEIKRNGGWLGEDGNILAWNDTLIINGEIILDGSIARDGTTLSPRTISPPDTNHNALYKDNIVINQSLSNKANTPSTTTVIYELVEGVNTTKEEITRDIETNSVTVHTPIVCDGGIRHDVNFNQQMESNEDRVSVILGKATGFRILNSGQHLNIPGYGNKDYANFVLENQVRFPFDVYMNTTYRQTDRYLPANTWYTLPVNDEPIDIYIPTWVDEGNYTVEYQTIAINAYDINRKESSANLSPFNAVATDTSQVEVIGRLYGFKITDINNYPLWEEVFRTEEGLTTHTDTYYYVGANDYNGNPTGVDNQFTLPLLGGSHPEYDNIGYLKTGYGFKFELETIGTYANEQDCISIETTFYYINKDGTSRQEVDLYYHEYFDGIDNHFIKMDRGRNRDNTKYIELGDEYRNVPLQEIKDTASILDLSEDTFLHQQAKIGWFDWIVLSKPLRTFVGDTSNRPMGVNEQDVLQSVQHWYGEYYLPNDLFVAPKNFDVVAYSSANNGLDGKENFWLRDGYIIVNFDIVTIKNSNFNDPVLSYHNSEHANMWALEGFNYNKEDYNKVEYTFRDGDIIFYYTDEKASDDYSSGGTH